ncbi:MAG: peptidoglycan editing factor PgeF [Thermodesulfobacteriota bacterium]
MNSVFSYKLSKISSVVHGFLNKRFVGESIEAAHYFGLNEIATLKQIHSNSVFIIKDKFNSDKEENGDAIVSSLRNLGIGVYTADCLPILLADRNAAVVAVVHAGWRGTLLQIAESTLLRMGKNFGIESNNVFAAIGPSIGRCCYEVGQDVAKQYMNKFEDWDTYLFKKNGSKFMLDLREANRLGLKMAGVKEVEVIDICTKCNKEFHSFRRDGKGVGKQLSLIGLV